MARVTLKEPFQERLSLSCPSMSNVSRQRSSNLSLTSAASTSVQSSACKRPTLGQTISGPTYTRMDLAIERPHAHYGSVIFVTSGTIVNATSLTVNNIEILRVDLRGISVTSVYKLPGERFSFHQPPTAVGDQQQVIIGDFINHSSTWGNATTNTDGELVQDWAENQ